MGPKVEYATNAPLTETLRSVVRPGDFCTHGRLYPSHADRERRERRTAVFRLQHQQPARIQLRDDALRGHAHAGLAQPNPPHSAWVYAPLRRFRSGIEAGISYLKRCFGIGRCNWRGSTASRPTCTLRYSPTTSCASCGCAPPDGIDPNRPPRFPRLGSGGSKPNQITESALTTCFRYDLRRRAQVVRVPRDKAIKSSSIVQTIVPTRRPFLRPSTAHSRISGVPDRRDG